MSKLSITRNEEGNIVFDMKDVTGTKEEQQQEFVDFFLDVQDMIDALANNESDRLEVIKSKSDKKVVKRFTSIE